MLRKKAKGLKGKGHRDGKLEWWLQQVGCPDSLINKVTREQRLRGEGVTRLTI